jgi:hypothetical protein
MLHHGLRRSNPGARDAARPTTQETQASQGRPADKGKAKGARGRPVFVERGPCLPPEDPSAILNSPNTSPPGTSQTPSCRSVACEDFEAC